MRRILLALMLTSAFTVPALTAAPAHAEEFTRAQIEAIIKDYIEKNPKVMIDSVEAFGKQQQKVQDQLGAEQITKNSDWLLKNKDHAEAGNPKGDVTVVEFFDYNCGYCKQALGDVLTLLDKDKKLRLVFVEIPILGDSSVEAAKYALAAKKQNLYLEYHIAMMRHKGPINADVMLDYAKQVGINTEKMKKDAQDPAIAATIEDNLRMARTLGITGTPAFVVGKELIRGYVGLEGMSEAVSDARKAK